jgi:hypothetical protein
MVQGLGFRVQGSGLRDQGLRFSIWGSVEFRRTAAPVQALAGILRQVATNSRP